MANLARTTVAVLICGGLALTASACGKDTSSGSSAQVTLADWSKNAESKPWAKAGDLPQGANPARKSVKMPALGLTAGSSATVDPYSWPDAKDLFTQDALAALFPDGKDIEVKDCAKGSFEDDRSDAPKNTRCTIAVTMPSDRGGKSTLQIGIRAIGVEDAITKNFEKENGDLINGEGAKDSTFDTVWKNGAFGAKRLVKSGFEYRLLVSDGKVGIWYVITPDGFFNFGQADEQRTTGFQEQLLPYLVQDLAWRMPAG